MTLAFPLITDTAPLEPIAGRAPTGSRPRVLVMDDEPSMRRLLERMLAKLDVEMVGVADGDAAVERYDEGMAAELPFDAVILDLTIPEGVGGVETLHRLLAIDPDVRAIVASGYSDDATLANARANGFVGSIRKPFELEELARALARVLPESVRRA